MTIVFMYFPGLKIAIMLSGACLPCLAGRQATGRPCEMIKTYFTGQATDSVLKLFLSGVPGSYCCTENNGNVFIL